MNLDWMAGAACMGQGDLFVADDREGPLQRAARERKAKRICAGCPSRLPCLEYGESLPPDLRKHGVYGGVSEADRKRQVRRAAAARRREQREQVAA